MRIRNRNLLIRYRISIGFFIVALLLSGFIVFTFEPETALLNRLFGINGGIDPTSFFYQPRLFISSLHYIVHDTYTRYPVLAYNTDWLGFGHFVIAAFFVLPFLNPVRYRAVLYVGLMACGGVIVVGLISGALHHVLFFWTALDCSFGIIGAIPLLYCLRLTDKIGPE